MFKKQVPGRMACILAITLHYLTLHFAVAIFSPSLFFPKISVPKIFTDKKTKIHFIIYKRNFHQQNTVFIKVFISFIQGSEQESSVRHYPNVG